MEAPLSSSDVVNLSAAVSAESAAGISGPISQSTDECTRAHLTFTGTGAEYFRIWVVHVLLSVLTLGIYSAWAKVRKARWFAQHTRLFGDAFDYHGQPKRILLGRLAALALFFAYSRSFEWSRTAGLAVIAVLLVVGPILVNSAQRFRMTNTSWRGVRFGFDATPWKVYAACVPLLLLWTAGTLWTVLRGSAAGVAWVTFCSALVWPAAHASFKRLQHQQARFGDVAFTFTSATGAFYGLYAQMFGISLGVGIALGILASILRAIYPGLNALILGFGFAGILYLMLWPYFTARMQQIVWSRTSCGGTRLFSDISAARFIRLAARHIPLVLLTAGLYWPFAAVAFARYRVESVGLESVSGLPQIVARANQPVSAVGDAAFDIFGLDLGW